MFKYVHKRTFMALGDKANSILSSFHHELGEKTDPAYFALYLKSNRRNLGLSEALLDLATLEWTIHNLESQVGSWRRNEQSGILSLNPSLNLLQLQYDVWSVIKDEKSLEEIESEKMAHVLAVYIPPDQRLAVFCKILAEWALIIDALSEGARLQSDLVQIISKKYKVLFPKNYIQDIILHLQQLYIIEPCL